MASEAIRKMNNQVFGLGLMAATGLIMLAVSILLQSQADFVATGAVIAVVLGAVAFLVWKYQTLWTVIVGVVVCLAAGSTVFYLAFGVFQPFSPLEFVTGLIFLIGFFFALFGAIGALVRRSGDGPPRGLGLRTGALAVIGIGALVSIVGFLFTRTSVDATAASGAVVVDMNDLLFEPEDTRVPEGGRLLFTNSDLFAHDFTLEEYDLYTYFGPGSDALVDVSELPPGTYTFICSLHTFEGEGMIGTLTVEG